MKKHLLNIFRDAIFYGSIGVANRLASLLITPIIVRVFDTAEYGVVDALRVLGMVMAGLALFALEQAVARHISIEDDAEKKKEITGQALIIACFSTVFVMAVASICANVIAIWLFSSASQEVMTSIFLLVMAIPGAVCNAFALMLLRWNFRRRAYSFCATGGTVLLLVTTLVFVVYMKMGITGVFVAQLLTSLFPIGVLIFYCRRYIKLKWQRPDWSLIKFAFPLSLVAQASNLQSMLERIVVLRFIGLDGLGVFGVAQSAARVAKFPADSLYMAWYPYYSKHFREAGTKSLEAVLMISYGICSVLFLVGIDYFAELVIRIFAGEKYVAAADLLAVILGGYLFEAGASLIGIKILLIGQSGRWSALYFLQGTTFVACSFLLSGEIGLIGIAYAYLASRLIYFIAVGFKSLMVSDQVYALARQDASKL